MQLGPKFTQKHPLDIPQPNCNNESFVDPGCRNNKTKLIVQWHYGTDFVDHYIRSLGNCIGRETSKMNSVKIVPVPMHVGTSGLSELVAIDMYEYEPLLKFLRGNDGTSDGIRRSIWFHRCNQVKRFFT